MKGFADKLISWYDNHKRDLPWRRTKDPYHVWLSEIILQQTRVDQGMSYYLTFINEYPSVQDLAHATEDHVLANWQGLGYYSRARNLHASAKYICNELKGVFPNTYTEILKLKGVGPYTAAAIASFSFKEIEPVVDGNVLRVMSRFMGIEEPINKPLTQHKIKAFCKKVICKDNPDTFNQAIMEFGSLFCRVKNPDCKQCIFKNGCKAYEDKTVKKIPFKEKTLKRSTRYFDYLFFYKNDSIWIKKRKEKGIWLGLHEGYLIESKEDVSEKVIKGNIAFVGLGRSIEIKQITKRSRHVLSHQDLWIKYWFIYTKNSEEQLETKDLFQIHPNELENYGFPIVTKNALYKFFR